MALYDRTTGDSAKKKSKLRNLKMPEDSKQDTSDLEDQLDGGADEDQEGASEDPMRGPALEIEIGKHSEQGENEQHLAEISDDELLAEIKKRGLMAQLQGGKKQPGQGSEAEDGYSDSQGSDASYS